MGRGQSKSQSSGDARTSGSAYSSLTWAGDISNLPHNWGWCGDFALLVCNGSTGLTCMSERRACCASRCSHPRSLSLTGNCAVRRSVIKALYPPLEAAAVAATDPPAEGGDLREQGKAALLSVYEEPDMHVGLYTYVKALEAVEAGLLGGFFYQHFRLAGTKTPKKRCSIFI